MVLPRKVKWLIDLHTYSLNLMNKKCIKLQGAMCKNHPNNSCYVFTGIIMFQNFTFTYRPVFGTIGLDVTPLALFTFVDGVLLVESSTGSGLYNTVIRN